MTNYEVQNMYEQVLDEKYLDRPRLYAEQDRIRCELLSQYLLVGSSGSMKTNSALQIMLAHGKVWDTFTVFCPSLDEPLYRWLQDYVAEEQRQGRVKWAKFCTDLKQLPLLQDYEKEKDLNHHVLLDDLMSCSKEDLKLVDPFFMKSRKVGITLFVLSQDWTRLPLFWRRNFTYAVFKNISARQLRRIAGDVTSPARPRAICR
jgi:hypothetical protein